MGYFVYVDRTQSLGDLEKVSSQSFVLESREIKILQTLNEVRTKIINPAFIEALELIELKEEFDQLSENYFRRRNRRYFSQSS